MTKLVGKSLNLYQKSILKKKGQERLNDSGLGESFVVSSLTFEVKDIFK